MSYCTLDDLRRAVGSEVTKRYFCDDPSQVVEDQQAVASVLAHTEAIIDGKLSRLFTISTLRADPPALLKTIAVDLALSRMGQRRPEFLDNQGRAPFWSNGKGAMELLEQIRKGELRLDVNGTPERPANVKNQGAHQPSSATNAPSVTSGFIRNGSGDF